MNNLSLLQQKYVGILCANINAKLSEKGIEEKVNTVEGIFQHMYELTESIWVFGEEHKYLPLATKKLLAYVADPHVSITVKETRFYDNGNCCAVSAIVKWSDTPGDGVEGFAKRNYTEIFKDQSIPSEERKEKLESVVRGLAESRALTNAGIGLDLFCDSLDLEIQKVEREKTEKLLKDKAEAKLPEFPSVKEEKASRAASRAAKRAASTSTEVEEKTAVTEPSAETNASEQISLFEAAPEEKTESTENSSISLEDALNTVADIGDYTGFTFGDILAKNPRNLIWLVNAGSKVADAAIVVIDSNEKLKALAGR